MSIVVVVALLIALLAVRVLLPAGTPGIRVGGRARASGTVARLEQLVIGGSAQWVLERSENIDNPVLLYLHGGPGTSELTLNRRNTRELERFFVVVNWDQRGAGKSYAAIKDAGRMKIEQFVEDTRQLTLHLLEKYHKERIVLAGHSWGSVIGALTVARYPELYSCYVGIGQVASMAENEAASYRWTLEQARARDDRRAVEALETMGPPPYDGDWQAKTVRQRMYLGRFGGEVHRSRSGAFGLVIRSLLFSREYGLVDRLNFFRGIFGSMRLLWPELLAVDLTRSVPEIKVPVFFMEGRFDREAPSDNAARYFDSLKAPSKELIWFEESAHLPNSEQRAEFNRIMIERVVPFAVGRRASR
jgi:pimeloyl-ACP methyl ester carboxylesterase